MTETLIDFIHEMDRCWLEGRFDDLADYIADDVVMVAPDGKQRFEGIAAAVETYREFTGRCRVDRYETREHVVTERGATAIIEVSLGDGMGRCRRAT